MNFERYVGSKGGSGVWQRIISQMPPHTTYIEGFLGTGQILRRKRPAAVNIGIEKNQAVVRQWAAEAFPCYSAVATGYGGDAGSAIINGDVRSILKSYRWAGGELVYLDPPYLFDTRSFQKNVYEFEMSDGEHLELLKLIKRLPCLVLISGYWSAMYDRELRDWRPVTIPTVKRNGERVTEWLWCNFPEPVQLHDYRFVGTGRRERERIKKKKLRWLAKLKRLSLLERHTLLAAIAELTTPEAAALDEKVDTSHIDASQTGDAKFGALSFSGR